MKQLRIAAVGVLLWLAVGCGVAELPAEEPTTSQSAPTEIMGADEVASTLPPVEESAEPTITELSTATAVEGTATKMPEPEASATQDSPPTDTPEPVPSETEDTAASNPAPPVTPESTPQLVSPATVNLSEITPEPVGSVAPVELPNPGSPNPKVMLSNKTMEDLAARLGIDVSQVTLVQVEDVEWRDSGLGCAAPNQAVMDVITRGFRIVLEANGQQYVYHTDRIGSFVLCDNGQPAPRVDQ